MQSIEIAITAALFAFSVLVLARQRKISFRYTIGWLSLSALSFIGGLLLPVIEPIAGKFRLDAFSFVGAISVIVLLGLCIQLSISISGVQSQLRKLNEDLALQKRVLEDLRDPMQ